MQTYTPTRLTPSTTHLAASAALGRLAQTHTSLSVETSQLPKPQQPLLDALKVGNQEQITPEFTKLMKAIDDYWLAPSAGGLTRHALFVASLKASLLDEAVLKSHEGKLGLNPWQCLPSSAADNETTQPQAKAFSLQVKFDDQIWVDIKGALVMSEGTGRTLLALPGCGMTEYSTHKALCETLAQWLNDGELRRALLINADQRHQDAVFAVADDTDLFIDAFEFSDVHLEPIAGDPYEYAFKQQVDKQREDLRYVCAAGLSADPNTHAGQIESAIRLAALFGPSGMLALREQILIERQLRTKLPDWMRNASPDDLKAYMQRLTRYDLARDALDSVLNGATSADHYAQVCIRASLANDLGYDLRPETITVSTQRTLPVTDEVYTTTRSLPQLALYGLHPDDLKAGSQFLSNTIIDIDGTPATNTYPLLTPAYVGELIGTLSLRTRFDDYQRKTYAKTDTRKLMREVLQIQIEEQAYAARMQNHVSVDDFGIIEKLIAARPATSGEVLSVQQIRLNNSDILGRILIFRKEGPLGRLERLIMFTADAPRDQLFHSFNSETQLLHELVGWTAIPDMSAYLLDQVAVPRRAGLDATLQALQLKPFPAPDFLALTTLQSFDNSLHSMVDRVISVTRSQNETHTPRWYLSGSQEQRQKLVALEDAAQGAISNYQAQPHTGVQDFEAYVHGRASEKICQLLNVPAGTVDPDDIVIRSERETLTYTRMMRNGYDDSIGLLNPTADTMATFSGPEGVDLSMLTPAAVAGSVRGRWLADAYTEQVRRTLLDTDSTGYAYRRQTSTLITRLHMQAAALRSLLKGHIDALQYRWLELACENAHRLEPELRKRHPIYPLQIHVDKPFIASHMGGIDQLVFANTDLIHVETVQGCYALLPTDTQHSALLYTPNAPDHIEFRLFSSFVDSLREPGMIDYYKDRCRIKARRVLSFFLRDMKEGNANKAPFLPRQAFTDFAQICFNRPIERKLRDVKETTESRHDMLSRLVWNSVELIATVLTLPFPPASFAVGVALSLHYELKAIQALTGDTPDQASALILASLLNVAGAAGDLATGLKGFGGLARKLAKESRNGALPPALRTTEDLAAHSELFPVSLRGEPLLIAKPDANGHAQVFRTANTHSGEVHATGQYAIKHIDGTLQPLSDRSSSTLAATANTVSADRVVNLSLKDLPRMTVGHVKGISVSNGKCYIEMNNLTYQVHYDMNMRYWYIVDPENPFAFFGRQPVWLDEHEQWKLLGRERLRGGGKDTPGTFKPLQDEASGSRASSDSLKDYELPEHTQPYVYVVMSDKILDPIDMGMEAYFEALYAPLRKLYTDLRQKLYRDAAAFFAQPIALPVRPALPAVDATTEVEGFLEGVFANSNGLVFSESARSIASKRLLITHMPSLAKQRVEVIYLPHLFTDKHIGKLAKYRAKGKSIRAGSHELKKHLKSLNGGTLDNASKTFDYYHLIKEAHRHGIEVRPLNSSVSYPVDAHPVASAAADAAAPQKMSNFIGHKLIAADVAADPSKRWVALLDQKTATTSDPVPGIAELEGAISVHIEDVAADQTTRISRDPGSVTSSTEPCDFRIEFATAASDKTVTVPKTTGGANGSLKQAEAASALADTARLNDTGMRWDDTSGWQNVAPQEWLADSSPTALQQSLSDASYEMPLKYRDTLHELIYAHRKGLDEEYFFFEPDLISVRERFFQIRAKLQNDARSVVLADLPPRPAMPAVEPPPDAAQFIERLYEKTNGMVIGEFHDSIASKKFIIDNLPKLAQLEVKTLYIEHLLTDVHQTHLDHFFETGQMSKQLLNDIRVLDRGHLTDPAKVYTFEKLLIKAQQQGVEVRGIDCAASYHLKGIRQETPTTRQQLMSYFASRTIRKHQTVIGEHKWVALVGNSHSNTYANQVPGLSELEGAIGLRVVDVSPGTSRGITVDAGEDVRLPLSGGNQRLKGDFLVELEVQRTPVLIRPAQPLPLETRLSRPGMFLTEQEPDNLHFIIHRSRDNAIHRTQVQLSADGKVYVDRSSWSTIHLKLFDDIDALVEALEEINLTRVA